MIDNEIMFNNEKMTGLRVEKVESSNRKTIKRKRVQVKYHKQKRSSKQNRQVSVNSQSSFQRRSHFKTPVENLK